MGLRRLHNADWSFESSCFVCEPTNERGLGIPFFHDEEAGTVVADVELGEAFSGAPAYAHGGIVLAVLDEAMAWATIALAGRFAVTQSTATTFHRPVRIGRPHRVEARLDRRDESDGSLHMSAVVTDAKGRTCADAHARFVPLDDDKLRDAVGAGGIDR